MYIRTKRWHASQLEVAETSDYIDFEWIVYTNRELISKIYELGPNAEVLAPQTLKELMGKV